MQETARKATELLDSYEIGLARHLIDELFWNDLCDDYIEIVKSRLYEPEIHGEAERRSGQYAVFYALLNILKLYAIYVPHITEYIYQKGLKEFVGAPSIHLLQWEKGDRADEDILRFGEEFKAALERHAQIQIRAQSVHAG